jgi:hypothetical protein
MKRAKKIQLGGVVCPPLNIRENLLIEYWNGQKDGNINVDLLKKVQEARRKKL